MSSIQDRVINILVEQLGLPRERMLPHASLIEDLGADDLDRVEITLSIEEEFCIVLADDECETVQTVADLVALVERTQGGRTQ